MFLLTRFALRLTRYYFHTLSRLYPLACYLARFLAYSRCLTQAVSLTYSLDYPYLFRTRASYLSDPPNRETPAEYINWHGRRIRVKSRPDLSGPMCFSALNRVSLVSVISPDRGVSRLTGCLEINKTHTLRHRYTITYIHRHSHIHTLTYMLVYTCKYHN